MLKLDFSIESARDRTEYVNKNINMSDNFTKKELETISNYILYGKDEDGTSIVDRKEVQIKAKHNSYAKKEAESLDALLEKPSFDERSFQDTKTCYRTPKPTISREKDGDVPGMKELWEIIDEVKHIVDVNQGKEEDKDVPTLTSSQLYEYQHYLIELRRQQFTLRDMVKPTLCRGKVNVKSAYGGLPDGIIWDDVGSKFSIAPMGLFQQEPLRFTNPRALKEKDYHYNEKAQYLLDFRNPIHVYYLFELYEDLEKDTYLDSESTAGAILQTLDFYRDRANLTGEQLRILELKIQETPNQVISKKIEEEFGASHSPNYISTIYKQKICGKIAETAVLVYDYYLEREVDTAWKKCFCCGEYKLKDTREYMRRSRSADGLSSICKACDKKRRDSKKEVEN